MSNEMAKMVAEKLKGYRFDSNQRDSTTMHVNKINRFLNGKPVRGM
jgi:hypothetical protein